MQKRPICTTIAGCRAEKPTRLPSRFDNFNDFGRFTRNCSRSATLGNMNPDERKSWPNHDADSRESWIHFLQIFGSVHLGGRNAA